MFQIHVVVGGSNREEVSANAIVFYGVSQLEGIWRNTGKHKLDK